MFKKNERFGKSNLTHSDVVKYRNDIDGLRAIAVLLVVLFHFDISDIFKAGFIGVDIFFVISGFLIVPAIIRQTANQSFRFRDFYSKRIRRLAPPLIATITLTFMVAVLILIPSEMESFSKEVISADIYMSNIYYWQFLNYFGLQADLSLLLHTWSLAVEEQFYLFFPVTIWLIATFIPNRMTLSLVIILLASFALNIAAVNWKPEATFYLLPTRAWEFAAGALVPQVAALVARWRFSSTFLAGAGLILLGIALTIYQPTIAFPGMFAALPVAATVALIVAGADPRGWWARFVSNRVFVYIGMISYELYLVHWPLRVFAPMLVLDYSLDVRLAAVAACFIIAIAIFELAEVPIRSRRLLRNDRGLVVAYVCATFTILVVSSFALVSKGFPARLSPKQLAIASGVNDADNSFRHCENVIDTRCVLGDAARKPTVLLYGDSHADALASSFSEVLRSKKVSGYLAFQSGCLPVLNSGNAACRDFNRRIGQFISEHPEIRHVLVVSTWRQPLEPGYTNTIGHVVAEKKH